MSSPALRTNATKTSELFNRNDWSSSYSNVENELRDVQLNKFRGSIPKDLSGTLFRNGPGQLERAGQWVHHPFDGDGMITAIRFAKGQVSLSNRFVRTKAWEEENKAGRFLYRGVFGTQKPGGLLNNIFDIRLKNIANTNVIQLGNKLLALWEAASPHALDPKTLRTYGISHLNGTLKSNEAFSAHPRFDPGHHGRPRMVNFGVKTGPTSTIRLMEFATDEPNSGSLISERSEKFNGFAFLHDFAITPNWAIFLQNALTLNPLPFLLGKRGAAQCLSTKANEKSKFLLIPRDCGDFAGQPTRIVEAPEGFVFHHLNAWEDNEEVVLESIFYKDFPSIEPGQDFRQIDFKKLPEGQLSRCRIDIAGNCHQKVQLSEQCCEFAMVNPLRQGLSAKYGWMAISEQLTGNGPLQAIKKLDLIKGKSWLWSASPRGFVGEPVMVPRPNSQVEDDGWVLVLIWNGETHSSDLAILDAKNLKEKAIINLPLSIPHGLHGSWVQSYI